MTASIAYSKNVEFECYDFERSHGVKPRLSADKCGWAFKVYAWDGGKEIIWTRGRTARQIKAEVAAHVKAPVGEKVYAVFQP